MHIPSMWAKASGECTTPDQRTLRFDVWGWGDDAPTAQREAASRLGRLLERVQRGDPLPDKYDYGDRPMREEVLETIDGADGPVALVTRNRYGALVLNAADLMFLDIDLAPAGVGQTLKRLFGRSKESPADIALGKLREALRQYGQASFRIYRTAAGFRAIAVNRVFDPVGAEAQELMKATGTDPAFARLCRVQKSFRARLTPKPWCCGCPLPPGQFPRDEPEGQRRFSAWLHEYESRSAQYATCRFLEVVGPATPEGLTEDIVALHDALTRCTESLPLA